MAIDRWYLILPAPCKQRLAQRHKHTICPIACALIHGHDGGFGYVLGPLLPTTWLLEVGSSAAIGPHEVVVDTVAGLHEVAVITTDNSYLPRCSSVVGSVIVGGGVCPSHSYSNLPYLFPSSFLCESLSEFSLRQPIHMVAASRLQSLLAAWQLQSSVEVSA